MSEIKELLEHRKKMKKKKPEFVRQEYHKRKKLPKNWRRPRGFHSKLRLRRKGKPARVAIGYGTPKSVRHLTTEGLKKVIVSNLSELKNLGKDEIAVLSRTVGNRKRLEILKEAQKASIKIHNVPKIKEAMDKIENKIKEKKQKKQAKKEKEKSKKKEKKKEEKPEEKKEEPKKEEVKDEPKTSEKASK